MQPSQPFGRRGVSIAPAGAITAGGRPFTPASPPSASALPSLASLLPARPATPPEGMRRSGLIWLLTSYQGRTRRSQYWLARSAVLIINFTIQIPIFRSLLGHPSAGVPIEPSALVAHLGLNLLSLAVSTASLYAVYAVIVKRCHDRNKSGWFSLIEFVPLLNLWPLVELGFLDGAPGLNKYGPSPKGYTVDVSAFD